MSSNLSDACGSSSRDGVGGSGSGTGGVSNGDWICGDVTCSHTNFARRQQCKKCQRDRSLERSSSVGSSGSNKKKLGTEIGKAAAEKSRGLFSAEDWQCNKCANVNWARRSTCNMCNAPKFCDVEERTGFGGGYNDRGIVEYKEREESDSEYDEFGRLKKRRKNSYKEETDIKSNLKTGTNIQEEEEDEEEEGDDDDLAKYNLFSDDEEDVAAVKSPSHLIDNDVNNSLNDKIKSTDRRSRSRTRSDFRRRQSNSSTTDTSSSSTSSSTSSSSSSSSTSSSSAEISSEHSKSCEIQSRDKKSYSHLRSRSRQGFLSNRRRSSSREANARKRSHDKSKSTTSIHHGRYSSKSRSKSLSSNNSSRSPLNKRNRSRNSSLSRKHSRSPCSNRKRSTHSRSKTPKRRR